MASIRKEKIGSAKSALWCPFDGGSRGRVESYLGNTRLSWPLFTSLSFRTVKWIEVEWVLKNCLWSKCRFEKMKSNVWSSSWRRNDYKILLCKEFMLELKHLLFWTSLVGRSAIWLQSLRSRLNPINIYQLFSPRQGWRDATLERAWRQKHITVIVGSYQRGLPPPKLHNQPGY